MRFINCPYCNEKLVIDSYSCDNCSSIIRDRVPNLDLFNILYLLIFDPKLAITKILYSEQKNYLLLLLFSLSIKVAFIMLVSSRIFDYTQNFNLFLLTTGIYLIALIVIFVLLFSILFVLYKKIYDSKVKIKNLFSIFIYSTSIFSLSFFILFPIEVMMFGAYIFSSNPSPFDIKSFVSYALLIIEICFFCYSIFLLFYSFFIYLRKTIFPFFIDLLFTLLILSLILFSEKITKLILVFSYELLQ